MTSVEVQVLEMTDHVVTVIPVAKAFQNCWKNRFPRSDCFPTLLSFSSSIEDEISNGDWREGRVKPVLGSAVGITLIKIKCYSGWAPLNGKFKLILTCGLHWEWLGIVPQCPRLARRCTRRNVCGVQHRQWDWAKDLRWRRTSWRSGQCKWM